MNAPVDVWAGFLPTLVFLFIMGLVLPHLTNPRLLFGVSLPSRMLRDKKARGFKALYRNLYLALSAPLTAFLIWGVFSSKATLFYATGVYAQLFLLTGVYLFVRSRVKQWKARTPVPEGEKPLAAASMDVFSGDSVVSWWWFSVPLGLIAMNTALTIVLYDSMPASIPVHWGFDGQVDHWATKSWQTVLLLPLIQLILTGIMVFAVWVMRTARQKISVEQPEASLLREQRLRQGQSAFAVFLNTVLVLMFSYVQLNTMGIVKADENLMLLVMGIALSVVFAGVLLSVWWAGKAAAKGISRAKDTGARDADDDEFWKWGLFYYNPKDPAMWVEKRFGIGWTVNFGNKKSVAVFIGLLVAISLIFLLQYL